MSWLTRRRYLTRAPFLIVLVLLSAYTLLFSFMQVRLYDAFRMGLRDLGFNEQALDNTLQGRPFQVRLGYRDDTANSLVQYNGWEERSLFTEHVYFLLPLWLPLYAPFGTPYGLFVAHALGIALAAVPLFLLARRRLQSEWLAAAVAGLFLLYPGVQLATLGLYVYGPHLDNLAPLFLFALLYFADAHRARGFWIMGALSLATVDTVAPTVAALGLYLALADRAWRRHALALTLAAVAVGALDTLVIIPAAWGGQARPAYYFAALQTLPVLVRHPELFQPIAGAALQMLGGLLLPLGCLPCLAPMAWLIALPELITGLLAQTVGYTLPLELGSWHVWAYALAAFVAMLQVLHVVRQRWGPRSAALLTALLVPLSAASLLSYGPFPFSRDVLPTAYEVDAAKAALIAQAQAQIPYTASLSVEFFAGSHFANRPNVYWFPVEWRHTQFVLVDERTWAWWSDADARALSQAERSGNLQLRWTQHGLSLFERRPAPAIAYALDALFDGRIELLGYNLERGASETGPMLDLILFWRARAPVETNLRVFTHVVTPEGVTVAQKDNQPDNGTYPTSEWPGGEVVVDRYRLALPAGAVPPLRLEVGLYDPADGRRILTSDGADHVVLTTIAANP